MDSDITIRLATIADADAITNVHCSTVDVWRDPVTRQPTTYAMLDRFGRWSNGGPWMSPDLCAAHLATLLRRGHLPLIADIDGIVVGEAEYFINHEPSPLGSSLHLSILYIHTDWQRRGVGRRLVDVGVAEAQARNSYSLTTQPEAEAVDFYRSIGFHPWLRSKEMQLRAEGEIPKGLAPMTTDGGVPVNLLMQIGRYQCSAQGWDVFWPSLPLPELLRLRRSLWHGELDGTPVVVGIREQLRDPTQADGYAWLPPSTPLAPAVKALCAVGAREGFNAVDLLLPEASLPDLRSRFRLDYQTTVNLWRRDVNVSHSPIFEEGYHYE